MNWFKGTFTETTWKQIWFPAHFLLSQSTDSTETVSFRLQDFPPEGVSVGFRVGLPENGVSQNGNFRAMLDNIYVRTHIYIYVYI